MSENSKIILTAEDGSEEVFFVMEKATIAGGEYLLVADSEEEDAEALILKGEHTAADEMMYEVVEDEKELKIISKYFEELLEDVELRLE
ncbi:MAG: DUF1292 domain-containing protein [Lachnospiraceae bacterium]|nr:DUF1292 domain-containing protein [Lachnospiraceae bacterium]